MTFGKKPIKNNTKQKRNAHEIPNKKHTKYAEQNEIDINGGAFNAETMSINKFKGSLLDKVKQAQEIKGPAK